MPVISTSPVAVTGATIDPEPEVCEMIRAFGVPTDPDDDRASSSSNEGGSATCEGSLSRRPAPRSGLTTTRSDRLALRCRFRGADGLRNRLDHGLFARRREQVMQGVGVLGLARVWSDIGGDDRRWEERPRSRIPARGPAAAGAAANIAVCAAATSGVMTGTDAVRMRSC